jgi:hypothetical protein
VFVRRNERERLEARRLRASGWSVRRIAAELRVAKSSVSLWVRDVPPTVVSPPLPPDDVAVEAARAPFVSSARKTCSRCRRSLAIEAFNRLRDGRQSYCRDCFRAYFRERGDLHRAQVRATAPQRRRRSRAVVLSLLAAAECEDCGMRDVTVLEFDHVGAKRAAVATLVGQAASRRALLEEVARCDVVCANCHRRRTAVRAGWFRVTGCGAAGWSAAQLRNHRFVLDMLRAGACADCGETDPVVLEFDHRGDKRANVSSMCDWASLATLRAEIAKCDVRCANCHRVRTQRAVGSYRLAAVQSDAPP